ncbi:hypothetical protein [uncultured Sulfitobacter sp.]|uniref:COG4223 family protein n=1 Tax=uncultured Sulfitobacter sp. TaxID=191468 RepID=UPI0026353FB3|nr:hypothetical protein [uncultured Sulfitobacter sp.]
MAGASKASAAETKPDPVAQAVASTKAVAESAKPAPEKSPEKPAAKTPGAAATATSKASEAAKPASTAEKKPATADKPKEAAPAKPAEARPKDAAAKSPAKPEAAKPAEVSKPKPQPTPAPTPPAPAPQKSASPWPLVLGGVAAGVIGFIAAEMNAFGLRANNDTLQSAISAQSDRIAELETALADAAAPEMPDIAPLQEELGGLSGTVASLDERVTELVNRPIVTTTGEVDVSAYENQLADLQSSVVAQKEELDRLLENALSVEQATAEAARLAVVQGALTDLSAAITEGVPFEGALAVLAENGVSDIPAALADAAADGVPTLSGLQSGFTESARAALGAARASGEQAGEDGFVGFLNRSLGARSVAPREGSDPDAVLSRAEAAIREGALDTALSELDTLPAAAQDAMGAWLSDAKARATARAAAQDLSERLTAN